MKFLTAVFIIVFTSLFVSCKKETPTNPNDQFPPSPSIRFLTPSENAVVTEHLIVEIETSAIESIDTLTVVLDGNDTVRTFTETPYRFVLKTDTLADGSEHTLTATARFDEGKTLLSSPRRFVVYRLAPSHLTCEILSDTLVMLRWNDNSSIETGFRIDRSVNGSLFENVIETGANSVEAQVAWPMYIGDTVSYRICATHDSTNSVYAGPISATVEFPPPENLVILSLTDSEVSLSWIDRSAYENGFIVEHSADDSVFAPIGQVSRNGVSAKISHRFEISKTHSFRMKAVGAMNASAASNVSSRLLLFFPPSNLSVNGVSEDTLVIHWHDLTTFEKGFVVERKTGIGAWEERANVLNGVTSWVDAEVDPESTYSYRVGAYTDSSVSGFSSIINVRRGFDNKPLVTISPNNSGGNNYIWSFEFTPDGNSLVCAVGLHTLQYNVTSGALIRDFGTFRTAAHVVGISRDGKTVFGAGANDSTVCAWNIADGSKIFSYKENTWLIHHLTNGPDASSFAITGEEIGILIRSAVNGSLKNIYSAPKTPVTLLYSPSGDHLVCGTNQANAHILNASDGTIVATLTGFFDMVSSLSFNADGSLLATGSSDNSVKTWTSDGTLVRSYTGNSKMVSAVSLNPSGSFIASGGYDPVVRVWRVSDGTIVRTLPGHGTRTTSCRFSPDGKFIAMGGSNALIHLYKANQEWIVF